MTITDANRTGLYICVVANNVQVIFNTKKGRADE